MPGKWLWKRVLSVTVIWRCKRCGAETESAPGGGFLLCSCPEPHNDWELMVSNPNSPLPTGVWLTPNTLPLDFT